MRYKYYATKTYGLSIQPCIPKYNLHISFSPFSDLNVDMSRFDPDRNKPSERELRERPLPELRSWAWRRQGKPGKHDQRYCAPDNSGKSIRRGTSQPHLLGVRGTAL